MRRPAPRALTALLVTAGWTLACAGDPPPPEAQLLGIWSRDAGDGIVTIREFTSDQAAVTFTTRNWVVIDGGPLVLHSEARYFVGEGMEAPGGGDALDNVVRVDLRFPGGPAYTWDEIVDVKEDRLVLRSIFLEEPFEYERIDALPF